MRDIIQDLSSKTNGYFKLYCGRNRKGNYIPASALTGKNRGRYLNGIDICNRNKYISPCTYIEKGYGRTDKINTVCCVSIDINYRRGILGEDEMEETPERVWNKLCMDSIVAGCIVPVPTYIEYGRKLKLIYVFESPVCLRIPDQAKRKSTIAWLNRMMESLADSINKINWKYHAVACKINKPIRVPLSTEAKFKSGYDWDNSKFVIYLDYEEEVRHYKPSASRLWDVHALSDFILPPLPSWYKEYKAKEERKKLISLSDRPHTIKDNLVRRLSFLCDLQKRGWDKGHREHMCFLYWNTLNQLGIQNAQEQTLRFNRGFITPLPEKEVLRYARPQKKYKYRLQTFLKYIEVDDETAKNLGIIFDRKEYDKEYSRRYRELKKQNNEKKMAKKEKLRLKVAAEIKKLRELGKTIATIAATMKCSISTVKRTLAPT